MKRTLLLLASMALATLPASVVALVAPKEQARAAFPGINGKIVHLKDWKRGATAGLLDAPGITLEAEAEFSLLLVLACWTYSRSARSEPA